MVVAYAVIMLHFTYAAMNRCRKLHDSLGCCLERPGTLVEKSVGIKQDCKLKYLLPLQLRLVKQTCKAKTLSYHAGCLQQICQHSLLRLVSIDSAYLDSAYLSWPNTSLLHLYTSAAQVHHGFIQKQDEVCKDE